MENLFKDLTKMIFKKLKSNELLTISFSGEESNFIRINKSKVRQTTNVINASISLELIIGNKKASHEFTFTKDFDINLFRVNNELKKMRNYINELPEDPFIVNPSSENSSREVINGNLLEDDEILDAILPVLSSVDCSGIWASGKIFRGIANCKDVFHWFETENYSFDYSLITEEEKMVKETYAGNEWKQKDYLTFVENSITKLHSMRGSSLKLKPGKYRTFIAPAGVADFINMFNWGGISESAIRQGSSAFCKMRENKVSLSPKFNLREDFSMGLMTRFNSYGELSPTKLDLISSGILKNTLISSRTALEYNLISNKAEGSEGLRTPIFKPGDLNNEKILNEIGTGIYLSNLHYLNWSDKPNGRITGMTRYASFWIEDGEIKAPIEQMRFDDSFYNFFGDNLYAITDRNEIIPNVSTYSGRSLGGVKCPGVIVDDFKLTL